LTRVIKKQRNSPDENLRLNGEDHEEDEIDTSAVLCRSVLLQLLGSIVSSEFDSFTGYSGGKKAITDDSNADSVLDAMKNSTYFENKLTHFSCKLVT
jgi:hypothetical protein